MKIAAETATPRIYTSVESPPALLRELKQLSKTVNGADETVSTPEGKERPAAFDQNAWMDRARVSYVLADDGRQLLMAIGKDGRVDALRRGAVVWRFRCGSPVSAQPVADGGVVYLATADERIIALALDNGRELWSRKRTACCISGETPIGAEGSRRDGKGTSVPVQRRGGREEPQLRRPPFDAGSSRGTSATNPYRTGRAMPSHVLSSSS